MPDLEPVKVAALGRPGRRETIVALAGIKATVRLCTVLVFTTENTTETKGQKRKRVAQSGEKTTNQVNKRCDLAIATIIALALNSQHW